MQVNANKPVISSKVAADQVLYNTL